MKKKGWIREKIGKEKAGKKIERERVIEKENVKSKRKRELGKKGKIEKGCKWWDNWAEKNIKLKTEEKSKT